MARKLNKRGTLQDIITIVIVLVMFAVGTLVAYKVSDELNTEFQSNDDIPTRGKTAMASINSMYPGVIDNSFLLLTIGLCIGTLIFAMLVRVHPIFFVFFIIILVIVVFISGAISNIYLEMANNPEMLTQANRLTFISHIIGVLPFIIGVIGFILAIVMYKNWRDSV